MNTQPDLIAAADAALERVVAVQAQIDALAAERAEALLAFDAAFTTAYPPAAAPLRERAARAELACALRMPERAVETLLGEARVLSRDLPATLAALAEGRFSYRHAQAIVDETAGLDHDDREAVEGSRSARRRPRPRRSSGVTCGGSARSGIRPRWWNAAATPSRNASSPSTPLATAWPFSLCSRAPWRPPPSSNARRVPPGVPSPTAIRAPSSSCAST